MHELDLNRAVVEIRWDPVAGCRAVENSAIRPEAETGAAAVAPPDNISAFLV
jgi:hypothetical protein